MTRLLSSAIALVLTLLSTNVAVAQDFYGFSRVLQGQARANKNTAIQPSQFRADAKGGVIQVRMPDTAGTSFGEYEFSWTFPQDIQRLVTGKDYRVVMTGRRVAGSSAKNTNAARVLSSNSGAVLAKKAGIQSLANIIQVKKTDVAKAFPVGANNKVESTFRVAGYSPGETYFTLSFNFSSFPYSSTSKQCTFEAVYVYQKNLAAGAASALNCPALYGLGVNIGILEYASLDDARTSFLVGFVDNAVAGAKASGCVPATEIAYLTDLRVRLLKQKTGKAFAGEISGFRQKLARIVAEKCNCK